MRTLVLETSGTVIDDLLLKVTDLRTQGVRQTISPKHDVYAPRGKLRKCFQHSDLKNFHVDTPSRLALALCLISKLQFFISSTKDVSDGTYGVLMCWVGDFM